MAISRSRPYKALVLVALALSGCSSDFEFRQRRKYTDYFHYKELPGFEVAGTWDTAAVAIRWDINGEVTYLNAVNLKHLNPVDVMGVCLEHKLTPPQLLKDLYHARTRSWVSTPWVDAPR